MTKPRAFKWILQLVSALLAALVALAVLVAPSGGAGAFQSPAAHTYGYDAIHNGVERTCPAVERGPPAACPIMVAQAAVGRWQSGVSACPQHDSIWSHTNYDPLVRFVQSGSGIGITLTASDGHVGNLRGVPGARCAAKSVDEAAALVRYDAMAASRNLLGQVGEGYARTPSGYTVSAHAAERIVFGAPGRSPTTLSRVDDILNNPTRTMMRDNGTIRVYQGKDWVAVRDTGPMHIVTVMVR